MEVSFPLALTNRQLFECSLGRRKARNVVNPTRVVLKLFDWRYATDLREEYQDPPWTPERETAYLECVNSGRAKGHLHALIEAGEYSQDEEEEEEDIVPNEVHLYGWCANMYQSEIAVYKRMRAYQDSQIPRLMNSVSVTVDQIKAALGSSEAEFVTIRGILIEYIDSFILSDISPMNAPKGYWQFIVDKAIENVHLMSDNFVLNKDVSHRNVITYRVVTIDFALCHCDTQTSPSLTGTC
ncbi:hypothetical protein BU23DRAFT_625123 [Bimuria novae-zelandiae CBS 107.79]|uniref:Protein kinase domain-containing protein n=1 Tax=Bimuria novae-zelandiae CBS 107.79 TaxID=1447943 RepID=A0A6A5VT82_9PLEO|nr:hypothetical protein BU23DRAFT_625123 [Bimuria novae-zelandiae CBS 107.79]